MAYVNSIPKRAVIESRYQAAITQGPHQGGRYTIERYRVPGSYQDAGAVFLRYRITGSRTIAQAPAYDRGRQSGMSKRYTGRRLTVAETDWNTMVAGFDEAVRDGLLTDVKAFGQ